MLPMYETARLRRTWPVTLLGLAAPMAASAQTQPTVEISESPAHIPFELIDNRVVFAASVNASEDLVFVLDTGARATGVFGPVGDSLGLTFVGQARVGNGGEGVTAPVAVGVPIGFGEHVTVENEVVVAILDQDLSPRVGFPMNGVTGSALFTNTIVSMDFERGMLTVHSTLPEILEDAARIPITVEDGGLPYAVVDIELEDGTVFEGKMIVDLGQGQSMSLNVGSDPAITIPEDALYMPGYAVRFDGSSVDGHFGRIGSLRLGDHELPGVIASFPDQRSQIERAERQGSLGAEILRRFHVVFDYQDGFMYLTPNTYFHEPFEIDMSGVRLAGEDGALVVADVREGSAGAAAGLQVGDEIVEVDGRSVTWTMIPEIRRVLRTHGRTVLVGVLRDGERQDLTMELRRRV